MRELSQADANSLRRAGVLQTRCSSLERSSRLLHKPSNHKRVSNHYQDDVAICSHDAMSLMTLADADAAPADLDMMVEDKAFIISTAVPLMRLTISAGLDFDSFVMRS